MCWLLLQKVPETPVVLSGVLWIWHWRVCAKFERWNYIVEKSAKGNKERKFYYLSTRNFTFIFVVIHLFLCWLLIHHVNYNHKIVRIWNYIYFLHFIKPFYTKPGMHILQIWDHCFKVIIAPIYLCINLSKL